MRWKLTTIFAVITALCVLFARYSYLQTKYSAVQRAGGLLYFNWQNPSVTEMEMTFHQLIESKPVAVTMTRQQFRLAPTTRNLTRKCFEALIENEPVAVQIDAYSLNDKLIERLAAMRKLNTVLLSGTTTVSEPIDPALKDLLKRLRSELPAVDIRVESERQD